MQNDKQTDQLDLFAAEPAAAPAGDRLAYDPEVDEGPGCCGNRWLRTGSPWEQD